MARLLVIDDEKSLCQVLEIAFRKKGHLVETVSSGLAAKKKIESQVYDLIISDIRMPDLTGIDLLKYAHETRNPAAFILITAVPTMSTAIEALNLGAYRYVVKTNTLVEELHLTVERALEELALREENLRLRRELLRIFAAQNIVGHSRPIESILEMVRTVAPTTSTVLITGESGTGKELVARAIHEASLRREKPFVSINCGAFPETLLESELFGYLRGAFTGAESNRKGIIESAHGGTLFLDEIGETSLGMQVKLLRVLHRGTVDGGDDVVRRLCADRANVEPDRCRLRFQVGIGQRRRESLPQRRDPVGHARRRDEGPPDLGAHEKQLQSLTLGFVAGEVAGERNSGEPRSGFRRRLQQDVDGAVAVDRLAHQGIVVDADSLHLCALDRQQDVARTGVSGDDLELQPQHFAQDRRYGRRSPQRRSSRRSARGLPDSATVRTGASCRAAQTAVSWSGLPSQFIARGSNCVGAIPSRGSNGMPRLMAPNTVPSFGCVLAN